MFNSNFSINTKTISILLHTVSNFSNRIIRKACGFSGRISTIEKHHTCAKWSVKKSIAKSTMFALPNKSVKDSAFCIGRFDLKTLVPEVDKIGGQVIAVGIHPHCLKYKSPNPLKIVCKLCRTSGTLSSMSKHFKACAAWGDKDGVIATRLNLPLSQFNNAWFV